MRLDPAPGLFKLLRCFVPTSSALDFAFPNEESPSLFDTLLPSSVAAALPPEPLHVVGRALHCAPERSNYGFVREVKDESRVVGTWALELSAADSKNEAPTVCRAVLHACAASGDDAGRHTCAFFDLHRWDTGALSGDGDERRLYRQLARVIIERLRWLMNCLPGAWRLPPAPYQLRLLPPRSDARSFNYARLHELLEELASFEGIPGLTLTVLNNAPRYGL